MSIPDERIPIGIAVVEHDGCFLVGIRGDETSLVGCAEFPGGKCSPGEDPADCAVRECEEETGLRVAIVELLFRTPYDYAHGLVDLHFYLCCPTNADETRERHGRFEWIPRAQLGTLGFPAANRPVIELLQKQSGE